MSELPTDSLPSIADDGTIDDLVGKDIPQEYSAISTAATLAGSRSLDGGGLEWTSMLM
ncbi:MAG: hypothetical protein K8R36_11005 [Planctomycetales bacterium]|nr:hypothetical protein [Planctomycetales bacterium]